ncbi:MAG: ABC transporter permease [Acidilobaceae archaeon]
MVRLVYPRVARILAFRALTLLFTLLIIVLLTALIVTGTGYDRIIIEAQIRMEIQAFVESIKRQGVQVDETVVKAYEEELRKVYGLDASPLYRAWKLAVSTVTLDLYVSQPSVADAVGLTPPVKVVDAIRIALPRTIVMITTAYILAFLITIPLGTFVAYKRGRVLDKAVVSYAALTNALPAWWIAMLAILVFGFGLDVAPKNYRLVIAHLGDLSRSLEALDLWGFLVALKEVLYYAYLPVLVVFFAISNNIVYASRAITLRVVTEDFVNVARAKGLSERLILWRYVLRAAVGPILTMVILGLAGSIGGYIITEAIFDWPGMGLLTREAITSGDSPTVLGLVYVTTAVYIAARFLLEVLYVLLDPRVRL